MDQTEKTEESNIIEKIRSEIAQLDEQIKPLKDQLAEPIKQRNKLLRALSILTGVGFSDASAEDVSRTALEEMDKWRCKIRTNDVVKALAEKGILMTRDDVQRHLLKSNQVKMGDRGWWQPI